MPNLETFLSNPILASHTLPFLLPSDLFSLLQTSRPISTLLRTSPLTHRYLHPSNPDLAQRALTHLPLRHSLRVLVLDDIALTPCLTALLHDLPLSILSVRGKSRPRTETDLFALFTLLEALSRDSPLGLYIFRPSPKHLRPIPHRAVAQPPSLSLQEELAWLTFLARHPPKRLVFDLPLCPGAAHTQSTSLPKFAKYVFPRGCKGCGAGHREKTPYMRDPVPTSPGLGDACRPEGLRGESYRGTKEYGVSRCEGCIGGACMGCGEWWCADCFVVGRDTVKGCWECGELCRGCFAERDRSCGKCSEEYCILHNEGSTEDRCDWCSTVSRGHRGRFAGML